ncbi:MAG: RNA pyrophosphohydrolase [Alphaproteobacteria bacterium]|nr:RNA pyrophosphohydrolase [Alphaproteobacteria bacterium]
MSADPDSRPYRPCVGVMLLNADGLVFVGSRIDTPGENWQMPQGGIDDGESPRDAALRELEEEVGTREAVIVAESAHWYSYDLPAHFSKRSWNGRYRGQTQRWFAMRFAGQDSDIRLDRHKPEFSDWQWVPMKRVVDMITPFKQAVYREVIREFSHLIPRSADSDP